MSATDPVHELTTRDPAIPVAVILAAHGWANLGDHAITLATRSFLAARFPYRVITIDRQTLAAQWGLVLASIRPHDVVVLPGGGNLGDLWPHEEAARLAVVRAFPHNAIVSFPQSIRFADPEALARSARIYRAHPRLLLATRDDRSADLAREHLAADGVHIVRTEDIVLQHHYPYPFRPDSEAIAFLERDDAEKAPGSAIARLRALAAGRDAVEADTIIRPAALTSLGDAAHHLYALIDTLHAARLVVTDRLHGAIFGLLAGRPVVAADNSYGKIHAALKTLQERAPERILLVDPDATGVTGEQLERLAAMPDAETAPGQVLADRFDAFEGELRAFLEA